MKNALYLIFVAACSYTLYAIMTHEPTPMKPQKAHYIVTNAVPLAVSSCCVRLDRSKTFGDTLNEVYVGVPADANKLEKRIGQETWLLLHDEAVVMRIFPNIDSAMACLERMTRRQRAKEARRDGE